MNPELEMTTFETAELRRMLANPLMRKYLGNVRQAQINVIAHASPKEPLEAYAREVRFTQGILHLSNILLEEGAKHHE